MFPLPPALTGLALCTLLSSLGVSIANVALPALTREFTAPLQHVQWVVLAYLIASTTLVVGAGRLGDLLGRRRLLLWGIALFTLASMLCALAPTLPLLVAARALQGLGGALLMALSMASVSDVVAADRTGRAMGLLGTVSAAGTALGPSLGGLLLQASGWQALFLAQVPLGLVAWRLAARHVPPPLTVVPGRKPGPLLPWRLLADPRLAAACFMSAAVAAVVMGALLVGPFYLERGLGLAASAVGLVVAAGPVASALAGVPAGRWVDRWGAQPPAIGGLVSMVLGCLALAALQVRWGIAGYVVPLVIVTAGYAVFQAANNTAVMASVDGTNRGLVSGLVNLSRSLGLITGASLMGAVFVAGAGAGGGADAAAAGARLTFAVAAALAASALAVSVLQARAARASACTG